MEKEQDKIRFRKTNMFEISSDLFSSGINSDSALRNLTREISKKINRLFGNDVVTFKGYLSDFHRHYLMDAIIEMKNEGVLERVILDDSRYNDSPKFYKAVLIGDKKILSTGKSYKVNGAGVGKNSQNVLIKALGEFLERYSISSTGCEEFIKASAAEFEKKNIPFISPNKLGGYVSGFDKSKIFRWVKVKELETKKNIYVPFQALYLEFSSVKDEIRLMEQNSNGAAGHSSLDRALLTAIYELIERDAFLVYWLNKATPKRVALESVPNDDLQEIVCESKRYGFDIFCLYLKTDTGVPVFVSVISDSTGVGPRYSVGAGCNSDPVRAILSAVEESWHIYHAHRGRKANLEIDWKNYKPFSDGRIGQMERILLWSDKKMEGKMKFFLEGKKNDFRNLGITYPSTFSSDRSELNFLVKQIKKLGPEYKIYYFKFENRLSKKHKFVTVKAIIPFFVSMYLQEKNIPINNPRIKSATRGMEILEAKDINPLPHPFP